MKLKIPANNPEIAPIINIKPLRKLELEMKGKNVKDQKIIKTIFAAIVDTTTDIETRAIVFAFVFILVSVVILKINRFLST